VAVCVVAWIQPIAECPLGFRVPLPLDGSVAALMSTSANIKAVSNRAPARLTHFSACFLCFPSFFHHCGEMFSLCDKGRWIESSRLSFTFFKSIINMLGDVARLLRLVRRHPNSHFHCGVYGISLFPFLFSQSPSTFLELVCGCRDCSH